MENAPIAISEIRALPPTGQWNSEQISLLKRTVCKGATDDEFQLFIYQCNRTKLDPFAKQIYAVKRWDAKSGREVMSIQTGIDGYRLIADRTAVYEGQTEPEWCGLDGEWRSVWLSETMPSAARVGVWKQHFRTPLYGVALWNEYKQEYTNNGKKILSPMWAKMGVLMLSKCAEALALRKAFPQELSGVYTHEEMQQADAAGFRPDPRPIASNSAPESEEDAAQKEHGTAMKKARTELNKLLQSCADAKTFSKARGLFQKEYGKPIWEKRTYHNEIETFMDLVNEHWNRISSALELAGVIENVVNKWKLDLAASDSLHAFDQAGIEQTFNDYPALRDNQTYMDMMKEKKRDLGWQYPEGGV